MGVAAAGAAATIGSAAIGAVAGSGKDSGSSTGSTQATSNVPWAPQQPYLTDGLQDAKSIYSARMGTTLPSTYFAAETPDHIKANQGLYNQGVNSANMLQGVAASAAPLTNGTAETYVGNASGIAQGSIGGRNGALGSLLSNYARTGQMPGQTGADPRLTGALSGAAMGSLGSFWQSQAISNQVAANASDLNAAMCSTISGAGQFMNNVVINGQIDAVGTDISRNLGENTLYSNGHGDLAARVDEPVPP